MPKRFSLVLPIAGAVMAALMVSQPALGYVETGTTGTVGAHSLTDTMDTPGGACQYMTSTPVTVTKLNHVYVNAPHVMAVDGMGMEKVGWKVIVQRQDWDESGPGAWVNLKSSRLSTAFTDSTHEATFSQKGLKVTVPYAYGTDFALYRTMAKIVWFKHNGRTKLGTATELIEWYDINGGVNPENRNENCPDYDD